MIAVRRLLLLAFAIGGLVKADCIDGLRQLSAAEAQYFERVYNAAVAALPGAPPGWEMTPPPPPLKPALCTSTPQGAFSITAAANYRWPKGPSFGQTAEGQEIGRLDDEIAQLSRLPPAVSKERSDKMTACNEFRKAALEAEKAGNKAETNRLFQERNACLEKAEQVARDYAASMAGKLAPLKARRDELQKKVVSYSNEVRMVIALNEDLPPSLSLEAPDETVELLGPTRLPKAPGLQVRNVRLRVRGFPARRSTVLGGLDRAKLQSLLQ